MTTRTRTRLPAGLPHKELATIDHHLAKSGKQAGKDVLREVRCDYGACATILWSMLKDAGFEMDQDLHGEGVEPDTDQAVMWFRKAAEQGNTDAKQMLNRLGAEE